MEVKVVVKMDNTFVYNIVAIYIAPFDKSPQFFLNPLIFKYRYTLLLYRYLKYIRISCFAHRFSSGGSCI